MVQVFVFVAREIQNFSKSKTKRKPQFLSFEIWMKSVLVRFLRNYFFFSGHHVLFYCLSSEIGSLPLLVRNNFYLLHWIGDASRFMSFQLCCHLPEHFNCLILIEHHYWFVSRAKLKWKIFGMFADICESIRRRCSVLTQSTFHIIHIYYIKNR